MSTNDNFDDHFAQFSSPIVFYTQYIPLFEQVIKLIK